MNQENFDMLLKTWCKETRRHTTFKQKVEHFAYQELLAGGTNTVYYFEEYFRNGKYENIPVQNLSACFGILTKITGAFPIKPSSFTENGDLCIKDWLHYFDLNKQRELI